MKAIPKSSPKVIKAEPIKKEGAAEEPKKEGAEGAAGAGAKPTGDATPKTTTPAFKKPPPMTTTIPFKKTSTSTDGYPFLTVESFLNKKPEPAAGETAKKESAPIGIFTRPSPGGGLPFGEPPGDPSGGGPSGSGGSPSGGGGGGGPPGGSGPTDDEAQNYFDDLIKDFINIGGPPPGKLFDPTSKESLFNISDMNVRPKMIGLNITTENKYTYDIIKALCLSKYHVINAPQNDYEIMLAKINTTPYIWEVFEGVEKAIDAQYETYLKDETIKEYVDKNSSFKRTLKSKE